jgi:hypothetical protein
MEPIEIAHPVEGWNQLPDDPCSAVWWDGAAFTHEAVWSGEQWDVVVADDESEMRTRPPDQVARRASSDSARRTEAEVSPVWASGNAVIVMVIGGAISVWIAWSFIYNADSYYPDSENWDMIAYLVFAPVLLAPLIAAIWSVARRPGNLLLTVVLPALLASALFAVAVVGAWRSPPRSYARDCGSVVVPGRDSSNCIFWRDSQGSDVLMVFVGAATYAVIAGVGITKAVQRHRR